MADNKIQIEAIQGTPLEVLTIATKALESLVARKTSGAERISASVLSDDELCSLNAAFATAATMLGEYVKVCEAEMARRNIAVLNHSADWVSKNGKRTPVIGDEPKSVLIMPDGTQARLTMRTLGPLQKAGYASPCLECDPLGMVWHLNDNADIDEMNAFLDKLIEEKRHING